jgi:hypothetical protein
VLVLSPHASGALRSIVAAGHIARYFASDEV